MPYADQGLTKIPESVTDRQALFAGDILATGFWAARITEIGPEDTVLILGAGPTGICTLLCVLLKAPKQVIVCEKDPARLRFVREHYPQVLTVGPEEVLAFTQAHSDHGGADRVLEVAGAEETFRLAWQCARPNAVVLGVALYDRPQLLPLPEMYGKTLTFKTGGVDGCDSQEILDLIAAESWTPRPSLPTLSLCGISRRPMTCSSTGGTVSSRWRWTAAWREDSRTTAPKRQRERGRWMMGCSGWRERSCRR
ncbi:MAG: hypothetical protein ACLTYN_08415 [Dysosmobacter welbionis]